MKNRGSVQIYADLLESTANAGQDGILVSRLLSKANVSHPRLKEFLKPLIGGELINKVEVKGKQVFIITEKGRVYLEQYKQFSDMAESFGLNL